MPKRIPQVNFPERLIVNNWLSLKRDDELRLRQLVISVSLRGAKSNMHTSLHLLVCFLMLEQLIRKMQPIKNMHSKCVVVILPRLHRIDK
jgi:hypothetical protein